MEHISTISRIAQFKSNKARLSEGSKFFFIKSSPRHPAPSLFWLALPYGRRLS